MTAREALRDSGYRAPRHARGPVGRPASGRRPRGGSDRSAHGGRPRRARRRDTRPVREARRVGRGGRSRRPDASPPSARWPSRSPTGGASCPRWSRCGSAIVAGELGQILHVVCAQWDGAPPPAQFRRSSGGAFVDMGVHEFDVIRWLTDQSVTSVVAVQTPALDPSARPDADNAQALLGLSGGATAAVSLGRHYPGGDLVTIEVFGSAGHERSTVLDPDDGDEPMLEALARQAESFAELVRGGRSSRCGDGGCRCRAAGCRSGSGGRASGCRDRDVTGIGRLRSSNSLTIPYPAVLASPRQ